jgi:hypothetical protein
MYNTLMAWADCRKHLGISNRLFPPISFNPDLPNVFSKVDLYKQRFIAPILAAIS